MSHHRLTVASPGFGLGLRTPHYADFLDNTEESRQVDWLEVVSDNHMGEGGRPRHTLERIRAHWPVVMHGVAMSLAAPGGVSRSYLKRLKALADRIEPLWVSDHLCWTSTESTNLHDLNPVPYTSEAAKRVIDSICLAQDVLQRRLVIENVSSYVQFKGSVCAEWQFLSYVANEADCLLLLDVNNVFVSSVNHCFDALEYLKGLPAHRIQQIHLAGHSQQGNFIIDTHDHAIAPPVWDLYARACELFGAVPTMIERDNHIPPLPELVDELTEARRISAKHATALPTSEPLSRSPTARVANPLAHSTHAQPHLTRMQRGWASDMQNSAAPDAWISEPWLSPNHRFEVYHNAYAARLAEALADTFEKTALFMGTDLFAEHAKTYARAYPPQTPNLGDHGEQLPAALQAAYPHNPELWELADLEWHLRSVFDAADEGHLDAHQVAADPLQNWLHKPAPLRSHARWVCCTRNVAALWNAMHQHEEVPPPSELPPGSGMLVWRKGLQPHFFTAQGLEAQLLRSMLRGHSISQACEQQAQALAEAPEGFLTQCLGQWLQLEMLSAV